MELTKRELIDMFKNKIFPSQARHLKNVNYEGKGEADEQEYLRDTAILIDLAEKGLDYDTRLKADLKAILVELQLEIEEKAIRKQGIDSGFEYDYEFIQSEEVVEIIQQKINSLKDQNNEANS